jgi:hypothetical protein
MHHGCPVRETIKSLREWPQHDVRSAHLETVIEINGPQLSHEQLSMNGARRRRLSRPQPRPNVRLALALRQLMVAAKQ